MKAYTFLAEKRGWFLRRKGVTLRDGVLCDLDGLPYRHEVEFFRPKPGESVEYDVEIYNDKPLMLKPCSPPDLSVTEAMLALVERRDCDVLEVTNGKRLHSQPVGHGSPNILEVIRVHPGGSISFRLLRIDQTGFDEVDIVTWSGASDGDNDLDGVGSATSTAPKALYRFRGSVSFVSAAVTARKLLDDVTAGRVVQPSSSSCGTAHPAIVTMNLATCSRCKGTTFSGAYLLCTRCAAESNACHECGGALKPDISAPEQCERELATVEKELTTVAPKKRDDLYLRLAKLLEQFEIHGNRDDSIKTAKVLLRALYAVPSRGESLIQFRGIVSSLVKVLSAAPSQKTEKGQS